MKIAGLPDATVAPLIRAITDNHDDPARIGDMFARSAWSGIAEPGDRDAGILIAALGALPALELVTAGADVRQLLDVVSDADEAAADLGPKVWTEALARWAPRVSSTTALRGLTQAARFGCRLLAPGDELWPEGLDDLGVHSPPVLWVRGNPAHLATLEKAIAIVGARAATAYGEHVTVESASGLVDRGFAIVSGAAYGIDGVAHRAALASQGTTVAVLAGGLDRFYPSGHEQLLTRIIDRGVVVAEVPCGTVPTRWRFLLRNRLIAAMSKATVVVEAGWRSGSINTAGHAADLGRPIGAVPGPVTSSASSGCHRLLREYQAICVTNADEMAELVSGMETKAPPRSDPAEAHDDTLKVRLAPRRNAGTPSHATDPPPPPVLEPSPEGRRVLDALSARSAHGVDRIAALSGLATDRVRAEMGVLQLGGQVRETASGWLRRVVSRGATEEQ
ncbi:MAG TPA: DNA-processing protein DprA [Pseudolysinimonas sp.]|nr:DNA-processing protein DprA [Pseudolysinimonas sp.]